MGLVTCAACARHFKAADAACPFCGGSGRSEIERPARRRVSRAAMVASAAVIGVACGGTVEPGPSDASPGDSSAQDSAFNAAYGLPADASPFFDSGHDAGAADTGPDVGIVPPYGKAPTPKDPPPEP